MNSKVVVLDPKYSTTRLCVKLFKRDMAYLLLPPSEKRKGEGGLRTKGFFKFNYRKINNKWWIVDHGGNILNEVFIDDSIVKNYTNLPLISVITVVKNGENCLEETINSVINQTYPNVEYIIIDGGSSDRTLEIIKKYEEVIDYWISEEDKGIYDAMNKGIFLANGLWLNFMNCGDLFFHKRVLEKIDFAKHTKYALIYGNKVQGGKIFFPLDLESLEVGEIMACHQTMFFNRYILKEDLKYEAYYKIYADYELVSRIYLKYPNLIKYINLEIALYKGGGISSVKSFQKRKEKYCTLYKHYGIRGLVKAIVYRIFREFKK